ncbi:multicomponent Na+:H+ antiporter subunit A [Desulfitispora alkaliphila]
MGLTLAVLAPLLFAPLVPVLNRYTKFHVGWLVALVPFTLFVYFASQLPLLMRGEVVEVFYQWVPTFGINFSLYLDGLSLLFAMLITGIGTLVVLYSIYYLAPEEPLGNFYFYIMLFMAAMLGVVTSNNLILLYGFWELTSFSSFLLIGFWFFKEESRYGAQKSMLITVAGGLAMLAGFVLLYMVTGTFEIREIIAQAETIKAHAFYLPILILVLLGAFTKSAQMPFHIWLPNAMEAPTPVSAYLHSATMVKAGIFLIARMTPALGGTMEWFLIVSTVGIITMAMGSFLAIKQKDLKAILAFSTISQLGMIVTLLGLSTSAAVLAAMFHLLNHSAFKGSLFMMVGIVDHETGTRDISKLRGLAKVMPYTAVIAGIGALSMAGVPPFNGFLSKEMFFEVSVETVAATFAYVHPLAIMFPILAFLGSVCTFIYSMMIFHGVFFNGPLTEDTPKHPHEAPFGLLAPGLFLVSLNVIIGLFPGLVGNTILKPVTESILLEPMKIDIYHWHGFNLPLIMSIGVVAFGLILYKNLPQFKKIYDVLPSQPNMNTVYDGGLANFLKGSTWLTEKQLTGYLRDYLAVILGFTVALVGSVAIYREALDFNMVNLAPVELAEVLVAVVIAIAAVFTVMAKTRLSAVLSVGVIGYAVALMFVLFRAPDLALTQLIVETVTLALFLLCFFHLPKDLLKGTIKGSAKLVNAAVALGMGTLMTVLTLSAHNNKSFESISKYFIENSYELAGGKNFVNVILVDFRGIDTFGEIVVLAIAALGVYAMIKLRSKRGRES